MQLEYFRERLLALREEHKKEIAVHTERLQMVSLHEPDVIDRASRETDRSLEIQARDREQHLVLRINEALSRIDNGTYGYCEETGMPIGFSRLNAYPMATLSLEVQTNFERRKKVRF
ncbi:MAG: TraR/DksA C4-type zinc finger protein [Bacillota bacterium]|nr:TraR/DksA C4-type zinc finger protein [Bacillota bacterium]